MISMKSKLKVLYPILLVEFILATLVEYLSMLSQPLFLKNIEENFALGLFLVLFFKLGIVFFSFNYKEKSGVLE